jgi:hypothetical protein
MRLPKVPPGARHLRAYAELESYLRDFVARRYPFLWVVGRPGVGKSESVTAATRGHDVYYRKGGQLTPAQFYIDLYRHRGRPVVLDDAEHILDTTIGARLVSALGDTTAAKQLSYGTTSGVLRDVPQTFSTTSPLCVLANRPTPDAALQSRAVTLYFDPTNLEAHTAAARWFWDQEIHDWVGQHLRRLPPLDARMYVTADRDKAAERDWRQIILAAHVPDRAATVVQDLEADAAYPTREGKVARFVEVMGAARGASRASYFRLRGRLEEEGRLAVDPVPPIPLSRRGRPGVPTQLELDALDAPPAADPEEAPGPIDVPRREAFAQPVRGAGPAPAAPPRVVLDDTVAWEGPTVEDGDDESASD